MEELRINVNAEIYLSAVGGTYNSYPSETETVTDVNTIHIIDEHMKRFSDAWDELAKK